MAVVGSAREHWQFRSQSYDGGIWTAQRGWLVETDNKSDREDTVSGASGLPAYGELHPSPIAGAMFCRKISYAPWEGKTPKLWKVVATYDSTRDLSNGSSTDPEQDEVLVSFNSEIYQEHFNTDEDGNAVVNSAGDPFDPAETVRDEAQLIATIQSNHSLVPAWAYTYLNAVNNSTVNIDGFAEPVPTGKAKVGRIVVGNREKRGSATFYPVTLEIHLHRKGWRFEPLDQGTHEILLGKRRHILLGADLQEATKPVPLDGNGQYLENPTPATVVFGNFKRYPELNFTALPGIT